MIGISAQLSLYPLGQQDLAPAIQAVVDALSARSLPVEVGAMSTLTWGDDEVVFGALREAFAAAAAFGGAVLHVTISNACPLPAEAAPHG
ncbi:MAG: YkoF family thiamine/hydroxymethylpyrimidine-binding protein [Anaerolineae bacterium]